MINVFDYSDYRKYLEDYYTEKKAGNTVFSYQSLARKAGFNNRGFAYNIVKGKKRLSPANCHRISEALGHNKYETDYFETLVAFNQAKNLRERNYFFEKLNTIKSSKPGSATVREMRKEQYDFYSTWYVSAIRSLIDMHPFKDDYAWLAKNVYPAITLKEAKKTVALLKKMHMIKKGRSGAYEVVDKTITAGKEVVQLGILNFQRQTAELALKAIIELPKDKRNISGLTMGISRKTYETICTEIEVFQSKLQALIEQDKEADNVYQLNFHFFPISNVNGIVTGRQGWHND